MYDVDKIEREWYRYKRKKVLKISLIFIGVVSVGIFAIYFPKLGISFDDKNQTTKQVAINKHVNNKTISKLETKVPSLGETIITENTKPGKMVFNNPDIKVVQEPRKRKKLHIEVTDRNGTSIAKDIESRFKFAKDKDDALFLAKYYYDKNSYDKAEFWALETNKLDNNVEDSWIIFAKSLAKKAKRAESIKVLKSYYEKSSSQKAKKLMDKIRRGKSF